MTSIHFLTSAAILMLAVAAMSPAAVHDADNPPIQSFQEGTYQGKPIVFWLKVLRDRDKELMPGAFEAIRSLDQEAWIAVPELTRLVASPFVPIRTGKDTREVIAAKLSDIAVRSEAIDILTSLGESGAPAAKALVQWALTERIAVEPFDVPEDKGLFIELVALDAEQRMRVAAAVSAFGPVAFPMVAALITSPDAARRKLATAILSQDALPLAAELLHSEACDDRDLGLLVLKDMDLVVEQSQIDELARQISSNCTLLSKFQRRPVSLPLSLKK
jgi:hypothetical protein